MFRIIKKYKASIFAAIAEIIIVFVGISISFYFDEWKEENEEETMEMEYLEEMYSDLTADIRYLNDKLDRQISKERNTMMLAKAMHYPNEFVLTNLQFKHFIGNIFRLEPFVSNNNTFKDLTSTGNIRVIQDKKLRNLMNQYYNSVERMIKTEEINGAAMSNILTNDIMQLFASRELFDYNDFFNDDSTFTKLDMGFFKDPHSVKYVHLENFILLRSKLLQIEQRDFQRVMKGLYELREYIGKKLNLPGEKDFFEEFRYSKLSARELFNQYVERSPEFFILEFGLNDFGYELLKSDIKKAIDIFVLAVNLFPDSSNTYDSLGDAYMANKDYKNALANYKRALELDPSFYEAKVKYQELLKKMQHEKK